MLLSVIVVCCLSLSRAYVLEEELPSDQLELFLREVLEEARVGLSGYSKLENVNIDIDDVYYTIPFKFALVTTNASLIGPTDFIGSEITGQQHLSNSATIRAKLELGELKVSYTNLRINLYGLEYSGPAEISLFSPYVELTINIYRNVLSSCQADAAVSRPSGMVYITLGDPSSLFKILMLAVENFLRWSILPNWLLDWAFHIDLTASLEQAIANAANKIACK